MRQLAVFFATTVFGFSAGPRDAVMEVLEKVREGEIRSGKLDELGMSPHVGIRKKAVIGAYWDNLRNWIESEAAEFEFADLKEDGDLAAVVVNARSDRGVDRARVFSFGVKNFGGDWKVAPVTGHFMNTGIGFDAKVIARARALEQWMAVRQGKALFEFREAELADYLETLREKVDAQVLRESAAFEAFGHFQKAVKEKDADRVLIWLGVLERSVEDGRNWERISTAVRAGMRGDDKRKVWRLLLDSDVIRMEVSRKKKGDDASVLNGYISPYKTGSDHEKNRVIRFHLEKFSDGWRVKLPNFFEYADSGASDHFMAFRQNYNYDDEKFTQKLGVIFEEKVKPRRAESSDELLKQIGRDLGVGDFVEFLRFLYRQPSKEDDSEYDRVVLQKYTTLSTWWQESRGKPPGQFMISVAQKFEQGEVAVGVLQFETVEDWKPTFQAVWMLKQMDGWVIVSDASVLTESPFAEKHGKDARELERKFSEAEKELEEGYLKGLLAKIPALIEGVDAPDEKTARNVVEAWRKELSVGSTSSLLEQATMIEIPEKLTRLMRDLSGAMKGARAAKQEEQVLGAKSAGRFHGVSLFVDAGRGLEMHAPLVLVTQTESGPRVLADVELWYPSNQGKRIRNGAVLLRLKKSLSEKDFAKVKELFDWHEKLAGPVWNKWDEKNNEQ